jgi:hypothetical protein
MGSYLIYFRFAGPIYFVKKAVLSCSLNGGSVKWPVVWDRFLAKADEKGSMDRTRVKHGDYFTLYGLYILLNEKAQKEVSSLLVFSNDIRRINQVCVCSIIYINIGTIVCEIE